MKQYVICINYLSGGEGICCFGNDGGPGDVDYPFLFDTEVDAWKEIADGMITTLQQFVNGERELEYTDFSAEEYVVEVDVSDDGTITSVDGIILWNKDSKR